jgi:anaerobic magnesium-protoporphyrin IX monomethyl ester cyclase
MTTVLLIYPFFKPVRDSSEFRFPPLGLAYVAASLRAHGHRVRILDCTFLPRGQAFAEAADARADIIGVYSMLTMKEDALAFARHVRLSAGLLVAGGPLPTSHPAAFLEHFDVVVRGEGEQTLLEVISAHLCGRPVASVAGVACRDSETDRIATRGTPVRRVLLSPERPLEPFLDGIPFPARDLLPNDRYIQNARSNHKYAVTTILSTRGCPFACEFCSNVVFGTSYRQRSAENVVDEVEEALGFGYDHIHFADDVFTLDKTRVERICGEIERRRLRFSWECLGRVDSIDRNLASRMRSAGCRRIFFGIESGSRPILKLMNKKITPERAHAAVEAARAGGLKTGAFFILFYPGETDRTLRETLRFARSLTLDYLSFTVPHPIPGTLLYERVQKKAVGEWKQPSRLMLDHIHRPDTVFSTWKIRFGILKGRVEFLVKRRLGAIAPIAMTLVERPMDLLLRMLR